MVSTPVKLAVVFLAAFVFDISAGCVIGVQAQSFRQIGQAMEAFSNVLRLITNEYVDDVNAEEVVDAGIQGMLNTLDPYSVLFRGSESESFDRISTGWYVGFGYTVTSRSGKLVIADVIPGSPAAIGGLRIGDRLIAIDTVRVDTVGVDRLRRFTRGESGTSSTYRIVRLGVADTLVFRLTRATIPVQNIGVAKRLDHAIGYVHLLRFSRRAAVELSDTIMALKRGGPLAGLIIDLRGNPGGLLETAVSAANLFLPQGTIVVSTEGKSASRVQYSCTMPAAEPELPLVVLIDSQSASASEVFAGALQDHDRAVILGRTSFGKGLVQNVLPVQDSVTVKLTTSRYYTPSGRCVQRRERRDPRQSDTSLFTTAAGRKVRAGNGIVPDSVISDSLYAPIIQHLFDSGIFTDVACLLLAKHSVADVTALKDKKITEECIAYLSSQPAELVSPLMAVLDSSLLSANRMVYPESSRTALINARDAIFRDISQFLRRNAPIVSTLVRSECKSVLGSVLDGTADRLRLDITINAAQQIINNKSYSQILAPDSGTDH